MVPGAEIAHVLDPYRVVERRRRPWWLMANMVGSLDGSASFGGRVGPLSGEEDARLFRLMRALADVVLVGAETVRRERYGPVRLPAELRAEREAAGLTPTPPLAIVSRSLQLDWALPAFVDADPRAAPLVITCEGAAPDRLAAARAHAEVVVAGRERVVPRLALEALAERGHQVVLCEGGPTLLGEVAAEALLDELCLTIAPLMGGDPLPIAVSPGPAPAGGARQVREMRLAQVLTSGSTLFLRYERQADGD